MNPRARRIRRQRRQERDRAAASGQTMTQVQLDVMAKMIAEVHANMDRIVGDLASGIARIEASRVRAEINKRWREAKRAAG